MSEQKYPRYIGVYKGEERLLFIPKIRHFGGYSINANWARVPENMEDAEEIGNIVFDAFSFIEDEPTTMTNSLYYHNENIANWQPEEKQWWVTNFNPAYKDKNDVENLTLIGTIDFSDNRDMFESFKNSERIDRNDDNSSLPLRDYLIFDEDSKTVWILWWGL